jgi:hypothetical protein
MTLRPVGFAAVCVVLHRGAHNRGYKLLREGSGPKSLEWWWWWFRVWCVLAVVALFARLITLAPAFSFIASNGRARVTFAVKW